MNACRTESEAHGTCSTTRTCAPRPSGGPGIAAAAAVQLLFADPTNMRRVPMESGRLTAAARPLGLSYPLSRHRCCFLRDVGLGFGSTSACRLRFTRFASCTVSPAVYTPARPRSDRVRAAKCRDPRRGRARARCCEARISFHVRPGFVSGAQDRRAYAGPQATARRLWAAPFRD